MDLEEHKGDEDTLRWRDSVIRDAKGRDRSRSGPLNAVRAEIDSSFNAPMSFGTEKSG